MNAKSALDLGANTPAGAKRSSLIRVGSSLPIQLMEYGGFDTIASKGFSSLNCGSVSVFPSAILNLS